MWNSWNDVATAFDDWCDLLNQLDGEIDGLEQAAWEIARVHKNVPHFGNIRQHLLLERLSEVIGSRWPFLEADYHINAICSYFYINGESVATLRDLDAAIGEYCRENDVVI